MTADAARFTHLQSTNVLSLERNLFDRVGAALKAKGHDVRPVTGVAVGGYQGILFTRDPAPAGADVRRALGGRGSAGERRLPRRVGSSQGRTGGRLVSASPGVVLGHSPNVILWRRFWSPIVRSLASLTAALCVSTSVPPQPWRATCRTTSAAFSSRPVRASCSPPPRAAVADAGGRPGSRSRRRSRATRAARALVRTTVSDFVAFPKRKSTWAILGIGGAAALAVHPFDDEINANAVEADGLRKFLKPGKYLGYAWVQGGAAVGLYLIGRYAMEPDIPGTHTNKMSHLGFDLLRANLVTQAFTYGIKYAVRRDRPTGECCAFPSGHASVTFATAAVLERHFGYRASWPMFLIAGYVSASRITDNRHFMSDVLFGAALGMATGWTVVGRHGQRQTSPSSPPRSAAGSCSPDRGRRSLAARAPRHASACPPARGGNSGGPEVRLAARRRSVSPRRGQVVSLVHFRSPGPAARRRGIRLAPPRLAPGGRELSVCPGESGDCCWRSPPCSRRTDGCRRRRPRPRRRRSTSRRRRSRSTATSCFDSAASPRSRPRSAPGLVADRIVAAAADPAVSVDGLRVIEGDLAAEIALGDEPLAEDPRCRRGARAGRARRARGRPPGPGASGDRRLPRGPHARREGTERHHHARRDPRPRARHRADRVALAPPGRADDRAHGPARPDRRHPVVRGGARGPDPGGAEKRRPRTPDRRHPRRRSWSTSATCSRCGPRRAACPATSSASRSRRST